MGRRAPRRWGRRIIVLSRASVSELRGRRGVGSGFSLTSAAIRCIDTSNDRSGEDATTLESGYSSGPAPISAVRGPGHVGRYLGCASSRSFCSGTPLASSVAELCGRLERNARRQARRGGRQATPFLSQPRLASTNLTNQRAFARPSPARTWLPPRGEQDRTSSARRPVMRIGWRCAVRGVAPATPPGPAASSPGDATPESSPLFTAGVRPGGVAHCR